MLLEWKPGGFSNQGRVGEDTVLSRIAARSNHVFYLDKGGYADRHTNDDDLLPQLAYALNGPTSNRRLLVLHVMGSHTRFCDRLNGEAPTWQFKEREIACYLSSYRKTDRLLQRVRDLLDKAGKPWSMLYFADHGLDTRIEKR